MSNLKALLQDRKTKQAGRILKRPICLDTDLIEQREDLAAELADLDDTSGEIRMANPKAGRRAAIEKEIAAIEEKMVGATVQLVFRSSTFAAYEGLLEQHEETVEGPDGTTTQQTDTNKFFPALARQCFVEFRQHGKKVDDLGAEDFSDLLDSLPHGEADMLFLHLRTLHLGEVDLPKSVTRSATTRG